MRRPRLGVRASATGLATAVVAAALVIGGLLLVTLIRRSLVSGVDTGAFGRARDVAALATAGHLQSVVSSTTQESSVVQVVGPTNNIIAASENVAGDPPVLATPPTRRSAIATTSSSVSIGEGGQSFRLIALPVTLPSGPGWIYVATSLNQVESSVSRVGSLFAIGSPFLLALVAATTWLAVGRALRPVEHIRRTAAAIGGADLEDRLPVPATNDEIARLTQTMNEMLGRLQASAVRQRQFVGDASHELRSPLTALRAQVDVALAHPLTTGSSSTQCEVLLHVQQEAERMSLLIDDLLFLARADEDGQPGHHATVDLDDLVLAEAQRLRALDGPEIRVAGPTATRIRGSARDLSRMLRNVGDNAVTHANSCITISLTHDDGSAILSITDDGPGVSAKDRTRLFERFIRLDQSRTRTVATGGTGLGLAIAQQIAHRHGGEITCVDRADGARGATFVAKLPLAGREL